MKKTLCNVLTFVALLFFTSCNKEDATESKLPVEVQSLFSLGTTVSNPTNADWCKPAEAEKTLNSLRHVSKSRLFYMDQYVNIDYPALIAKDYREEDSLAKYMNENFFTSEGLAGLYPEEQGGSCSGFICHNEEGELLFCRNFDGWDSGPCVVTRDHANGFYSVKFCAPLYMNYILYPNDECLTDGNTSLHQLISVTRATMDGMNEYGLCFAAYQLPDMLPEWADVQPLLNQQTGKTGVCSFEFHNAILGQCKTIVEAEAFLREHDFFNYNQYLNVHWLLADATGDWAVFEYWNNELHVYREDDLKEMVDGSIPYEYNCIENYYFHKTPYATYEDDVWQQLMSTKSRIRHMMSHYKPVMSEEEALLCLQEGNYGIEVPDNVTDWSCVYNPAKGTILFNMRDDLSEIYKLNITEK